MPSRLNSYQEMCIDEFSKMVFFEKEAQTKTYDLTSAFDADLHKEHFINYLEVIIDEHGQVFYAVPSHQEKLFFILHEKTGITKDDFWKQTPLWCDIMDALTEKTKCIAVWNKMYKGFANKKQTAVLRELKLKGIYKGGLAQNESEVYNG